MVVILLKADSANEGKDAYVTTLTEAKIETVAITSVRFQYTGQDRLWKYIKATDDFDGLILTSPRCVQSIVETAKAKDYDCWNRTYRTTWREKLIFCVGASTAAVASSAFCDEEDYTKFSNFHISEGGNAESLVKYITDYNEKTTLKKLLYPSGNLSCDVLCKELANNGISFRKVVTYITVESPNINARLKELKIVEDAPITIVFFSPSGVRASMSSVRDVFDGRKCNLIAIGPTTRDALVGTELPKQSKIFVCDTPTPGAVLKTIEANPWSDESSSDD